jgi:hypothetical protein
VKEVEVFLDAKQVFRGDFESPFATFVVLKEEDPTAQALPDVRALLDAQKHLHPTSVGDSEGLTIPLLSFRTLEFQILDSLGLNQSFALSMIRLFGVDGDLIRLEPHDVKYQVLNCDTDNGLENLFNSKLASLGETFVPWSARAVEGPPRLIAKFSDPIAPVAIEIINSDVIHTEDDITVTKIQIFADHKSIWIGGLSRRPRGAVGGEKNSTLVFLVCSPEIKAKIGAGSDLDWEF